MDRVKSELTPASAFEFLLGTWALEREISGQAQMGGELQVSATGDGTAVYKERATVRTADGARFAGTQRYLVRQQASGVVFRFESSGEVFEQLIFVPIEHGALQAEAVHRCGDDEYKSLYVLGPERAFSVRHEVRGPRKAYVSLTRFSAVSCTVGTNGAPSE